MTSTTTFDQTTTATSTAITVCKATDPETARDAIRLWAGHESAEGHAPKLTPPEALVVAYEQGRPVAAAEVHRRRGIVGLNRFSWTPDADAYAIHDAIIDYALADAASYAAASGW